MKIKITKTDMYFLKGEKEGFLASLGVKVGDVFEVTDKIQDFLVIKIGDNEYALSGGEYEEVK